ncbi:MAG: class I SAM-dependent methyltransferase [Anaerolineaceae bacterium]|nr:class I SAM-dependent methyltransferase [Anaerolineaceae bacterium]
MTEKYYDQLAPYYQWLYADWEASVTRQAQALDGVLSEFLGPRPHTVLDVACGVGTQSIGLARLGYQVTASDLSPAEVEQARQAASRQGLEITLGVADMRQVWDTYRQEYDAVLACDNAVPHLLDEDEILSAFRQFYRCVRPGGCCLISVRDYAQVPRGGRRRQFYPRLVQPVGEGQIVIFDVWDFDGDVYTMTTYILQDNGGPQAPAQVIRGGKYFCVSIPVLENLFRTAGFRQVTTLRERFFQPLIVAVK